MDLTDVIARAKEGQVKPVYLLVGEEPFLMERAVSALRRAVTGGAGIPGFNEDLFHGGQASGGQITAAARTLPMMSDRRFILVRHVEAMKAAELEALANYIGAPNDSTCLVMTATKINGSTKLARAAKKHHARFDARIPKRGALVDFVIQEAKERAHPIARDAAHALTDAIGEDLSSIDDALERLGLYVGPGQRIDLPAVEACVTRVRVDSVWALVDAVSLRDVKRALEAATSLLQDREPPLRILALLARQLRMVARMREALARGMDPQDAAKEAGAPPFKARDLKEAARRFRLPDLSRAFDTIAKTDLLLKGSKQPGDVVLQHAIVQLC